MSTFAKVLCISTIFFGLQSAAADSKVGVFDVQRALQTSTLGLKAKAQLDADFSAMKKTLDKEKEEIEKTGHDLEKKRSVLSEEVFARKQAELQATMGKFQAEVTQKQNEMQKKQADLLGPIIEKMQKAAAAIAEQKGFSVILEKTERNVFFALKEVDLTDEIVKTVNADK